MCTYHVLVGQTTLSTHVTWVYRHNSVWVFVTPSVVRCCRSVSMCSCGMSGRARSWREGHGHGSRPSACRLPASAGTQPASSESGSPEPRHLSTLQPYMTCMSYHVNDRWFNIHIVRHTICTPDIELYLLLVLLPAARVR